MSAKRFRRSVRHWLMRSFSDYVPRLMALPMHSPRSLVRRAGIRMQVSVIHVLDIPSDRLLTGLHWRLSLV